MTPEGWLGVRPVIKYRTWFNTFSLRQNDWHFADNIFKSNLFNENYCIFIWILLKYVSRGPITNMPILFQIMACWWTGPRFNIETTSYQYRKSHCGDKTILRPSYLHNGISYTGQMTSLYWIGAQVTIHYQWVLTFRLSALYKSVIELKSSSSSVVQGIAYKTMCHFINWCGLKSMEWSFYKYELLYPGENYPVIFPSDHLHFNHRHSYD